MNNTISMSSYSFWSASYLRTKPTVTSTTYKFRLQFELDFFELSSNCKL